MWTALWLNPCASFIVMLKNNFLGKCLSPFFFTAESLLRNIMCSHPVRRRGGETLSLIGFFLNS